MLDVFDRRRFLRFGTVALGGLGLNRLAAASHPVSPADLTAAVFHLLGVDPQATVRDGPGRPLPLSEGRPVRALLGG